MTFLPLFIKFCQYACKLDLSRSIGQLLVGQVYEYHFFSAFEAEINPGESVWDVGVDAPWSHASYLLAIS